MSDVKEKEFIINNEKYLFLKDLEEDFGGKGLIFSNKKGNKIVYKELSKEEYNHELYSYERLTSLDIAIPKLIEHNDKNLYIIKEYIEGISPLKLIAEEKLEKKVLLSLFKLAELLNSDNLDINYFPTNFIYKNNSLIYVYYHVKSYNESTTFRDNGIYYWINVIGVRKFLDNNPNYLIKGEKAIIPFGLVEKKEDIFREYITWKHGGRY